MEISYTIKCWYFNCYLWKGNKNNWKILKIRIKFNFSDIEGILSIIQNRTAMRRIFFYRGFREKKNMSNYFIEISMSGNFHVLWPQLFIAFFLLSWWFPATRHIAPRFQHSTQQTSNFLASYLKKFFFYFIRKIRKNLLFLCFVDFLRFSCHSRLCI